jgi:hypothetical protein
MKVAVLAGTLGSWKSGDAPCKTWPDVIVTPGPQRGYRNRTVAVGSGT